MTQLQILYSPFNTSLFSTSFPDVTSLSRKTQQNEKTLSFLRNQKILSGEKEINFQLCTLSMSIPTERQNRAVLWTEQGLLAKTMTLSPNIGKGTQVHPETSKKGGISSLVLSLGCTCPWGVLFTLKLSEIWELILANKRQYQDFKEDNCRPGSKGMKQSVPVYHQVKTESYLESSEIYIAFYPIKLLKIKKKIKN